MTYQYTEEQFDSLHKTYRLLKNRASILEGILSDSIVKELNDAAQAIYLIIDPVLTAQDEEQNRQMNYYEEVQTTHNLSTIWSDYDVPVGKMDKFCGMRIKTLTYQGYSRKITKKLSYLQLWQEVELLVKLSGDDHHIFFEALLEETEGVYEIVMGS